MASVKFELPIEIKLDKKSLGVDLEKMAQDAFIEALTPARMKLLMEHYIKSLAEDYDFVDEIMGNQGMKLLSKILASKMPELMEPVFRDPRTRRMIHAQIEGAMENCLDNTDLDDPLFKPVTDRLKAIIPEVTKECDDEFRDYIRRNVEDVLGSDDTLDDHIQAFVEKAIRKAFASDSSSSPSSSPSRRK